MMMARLSDMLNGAPKQLTAPEVELAQRESAKLAGFIKDEYDKAKAARAIFEKQWYLNYAFYKGRQNVAFLKPGESTWAGRLVEPPAPPHRVRHVVNRIKPIIRTELSRVSSNKPNASVVPASSEDQDLFAAQAAEQLWESLYYNNQLHKVYLRSAFWMVICGTSFTKVWWDPNKICSVGGKEYPGDINQGAVTPFHLFVPDLCEEEIEDQPFIINAYTKPIYWVNNFFNGNFQPDVVSSTEIMGEGFFKTQAGAQKADSVLVLELWIKPGVHPLFPQGGRAVWCNGKVISLDNKEFPYKHRMYPFIKWSHIPTGEFYADSVIADLVSPQREYNRTRSQIIESKNRMAKPQLLAALGSLDPQKITTQPGQVIMYRQGFNPPQPLPLQSLPSYVLQEIERTIMDMEDISSQHEISRGGVPSGVTAATAISYLQERDDSPLSSTYQSIEFGWEKWAKIGLSYVNQFWDSPRLVAGTGLDGAFDAISLKGSDIASGLDIRMEAGSALPISKAAKQAFLMDCMKFGYIEPTKGLSMMDMGGLNKLYDELKADERQAKRENLRMRNLDIQAIEQHLMMVMEAEQVASEFAAMQEAMNPLESVPQPEPNLPPEQQDAQATMAMQEQQLPQASVGDAGFGQDQETGAPLVPSKSLVQVNSFDNHAVHREQHNLFRKSQAFEILPEAIKMQFEYHDQMHKLAMEQQMMQNPLPVPGQPGINEGASELGANQFGPPGTQSGALPPGGLNG